MAAKRKTSSKTNTGSTRASYGRQVRIRMYNVGFGDAFLVLLPDSGSLRKILFDCGSIEAAPGLAMSSIVDHIVHDVTDADGVPRIDVVVATHRHKDHVSGFGHAAWDQVEVKEVWMPWTEHPTDNDARRIRDFQLHLALRLDAAFTTRGSALNAAERREVSGYQDVVANALMLSNDKAMKTLHSGFHGNPKRRFLPTTSDDNRRLETDALPGVTVHVLGPSRSGNVKRDMVPPKGESFLRMRDVPGSEVGLLPSPFPEFRQATGSLSADEQQEIERAGSLSDVAVTVALDKAVNGTSLMLMLEISGTFLLFPGDAQWGTWKAAIEDPEWREMLGRVAFYKVGHHGSHNATPKEFVEQLIPDGTRAMASTLERRVWPSIPKAELLAGLAARNAIIARSDQPKNLGKAFRVDPDVIETQIAL